MIQLLFMVVFSEMAAIAVLSFKTPLRKLVMMGLDQAKQGRGPVMVKTVAGTVFVVMMSGVYNMIKIRRRGTEDGAANPTDQVLMAENLLGATLMGATLFLALMIDRLHYYMRELRIRGKSIEAIQKQARNSEDGKPGGSNDMKAMEEELDYLRGKLKKLESDIDRNAREMSNTEANTAALKKQSEGFLMEYDRLLEENQNLRNHLQSLDKQMSHSDGKKNT